MAAQALTQRLGHLPDARATLTSSLFCLTPDSWGDFPAAWLGDGSLAVGWDVDGTQKGCCPWVHLCGDRCRGIAAVCSPSPAASELSCIWQTQPGICYFWQHFLCGGGERHREHTHTQSRGIQGSCDLQARCKDISVSRMLSHSLAFPRCLNPTALLACDGFLSLGQRDSAAAMPPSSPHEEALLMLQLVLQLHRGAKNDRIGWLPPYTIPL